MGATIKIRRGLNALYAPAGTITLAVGEMAYGTDTGCLWIGTATGNAPVNIIWKGTYSAEATYSLFNVVAYDGSAYIWINTTPGSGQTPADNAYWDVLAAAGTDGSDGAAGAAGVDGDDGASAFLYVAYASDASGTDFTTTFNADLDYIAIKPTTVAIQSPAVGDFSGLWKNYKGATPTLPRTVRAIQLCADGDDVVDTLVGYIPTDTVMNSKSLVRAQAIATTAGDTNATTVQVRNITKYASNDALSSAISIASGDTVGTVGTINTSYDDCSTDDMWKVYVTGMSTTKAKGLRVILEFA